MIPYLEPPGAGINRLTSCWSRAHQAASSAESSNVAWRGTFRSSRPPTATSGATLQVVRPYEYPTNVARKRQASRRENLNTRTDVPLGINGRARGLVGIRTRNASRFTATSLPSSFLPWSSTMTRLLERALCKTIRPSTVRLISRSGRPFSVSISRSVSSFCSIDWCLPRGVLPQTAASVASQKRAFPRQDAKCIAKGRIVKRLSVQGSPPGEQVLRRCPGIYPMPFGISDRRQFALK